MENLKAILLIVVGSFVLATGLAFAGNSALAQAGNPSLWVSGFDLPAAPVSAPSGRPGAAPAAAPAANTPPPAARVTAAPPVPAPPPPAPVPSLGQQLKKALAANSATIVMGGVGAYVGFALLGGPLGLILGGLLFVGFLMMTS